MAHVIAGAPFIAKQRLGASRTRANLFIDEKIWSALGDWADYVYAGGQRIAKAEGLDNGLRIYGTNTGTSQYSLFYVANAGGLNGYTIRSGDKLYLAQYQFTGSKGGMHLCNTVAAPGAILPFN